MINNKFIGLVWFVMAVGSMSASAELGVEAATEQVRANLIASAAAVCPGDEILIGVHQRIIPHWHTYWKNPGDSGLPTRIQYQLSPGAKVAEVLPRILTPGIIIGAVGGGRLRSNSKSELNRMGHRGCPRSSYPGWLGDRLGLV